MKGEERELIKEQMELRVQEVEVDQAIDFGAGSYKALIKLNDERERITSEVLNKAERLSRLKSALK